MKLRVLNYRLSAAHPLFTNLGSIRDGLSVSDFDAFIIDPSGFATEQQDAESFQRRLIELRELVHKKGGVIVCQLRPSSPIVIPGFGYAHRYSFLQGISDPIATLLGNTARIGEGSQATRLPSSQGASKEYLRVLGKDLGFVAHLEASGQQIAQQDGQVFAVNSVGYPIAVEFRVGEGLVCCVPISPGLDSNRIGAAIFAAIDTHFGNPVDSDAPDWVDEVIVPGAGADDTAIRELKNKRDAIADEISDLEEKRGRLLGYRGLLFGYGKSVLESAVRAAFRLLGFGVPEPKDYQGEWDVELRDPVSGQTAIGEVEGSDGFIDVRKFRQLNDYVGDEELEGRDHKGILIGNGFRLTRPSAPERQEQFSAHAMRGVTKRGFCALPCTELFRAICSVLEGAEDADLRLRIRNSILTTVGVWAFSDRIRTGDARPEENPGVAGPATREQGGP